MSTHHSIPTSQQGLNEELLTHSKAKHLWAREEALAASKEFKKYVQQAVHVEETTDKDTGQAALELVAKGMPYTIPMLIGSAIHHYRCALDAAVSALLSNATGKEENRIGFPSHESEAQLQAAFATTTRTCPGCMKKTESKGKYAKIREHLPNLETLIFEKCKPWKDSGTPFWELARLDNIIKHRSIPLLIGEFQISGVDFHSRSPGMEMSVEGCTYIVPPNSRTKIAQANIITRPPSKEWPVDAKIFFGPGIPFGLKTVVEVITEVEIHVNNFVETMIKQSIE